MCEPTSMWSSSHYVTGNDPFLEPQGEVGSMPMKPLPCSRLEIQGSFSRRLHQEPVGTGEEMGLFWALGVFGGAATKHLEYL